MFNKLLLVSCICIVIALILYFFHWNRFIGFLIGCVIRVIYWNEGASSIWVEIGSIHISIIAGRILLKDVSYHSSNQTIKVVKGQLEWRYWIRRPTSKEDIIIENHCSPTPPNQCRIHISLQGFEWFLFNRTAAYESIILQMQGNNISRPTSRSTERKPLLQRSSHAVSSSYFYPPSLVRGSLHIPRSARKIAAWIKRQLPNLDPKELLPLGIEVTRGIITCGNSSTPNLLVAEFQRSEGTFSVVESRSKFDLYKQLLSLKFQHTLIRYVENKGYADPMSSIGELIHSRIIQSSTFVRTSNYLSYRSFAKMWSRLGLIALARKYISDRSELHNVQKSSIMPQAHQKTPANPLDDATSSSATHTLHEYAIQPKILETPLLELSYYFDVVGEVPIISQVTDGIGIQSTDVGNGDISPEWGFDIVIRGGFFRYGPWADRQRAELQKVFFPPTHRDIEVTPLLKPGDKRMWTEMRVFIEFRDNTVLHIPFREPSKDWQWDGKSDTPPKMRAREPAAIHLTIGDRSSVSYTMPMVTGPSGYQPVLEVHLDSIIATSSLNDIPLVTAESCRVHCEFPTPLRWNMERTWIFAISLRQPVLYIIRDHINMFLDLGKDWTTGPQGDYRCFVPMAYAFEVDLHQFELNMYANDHNIIDKPLIRDENALLSTRGTRFNARAEIFLNKYRPESTTIPFVLEAPDISISLSLPRWNTNALYAPREGHSLAKVRVLRIDGSYQYFSDIRKEHVEQLKLKFMLRNLAFKELGWSIRYFLIIRDNYLGSFTHFSTLYEYLDKRRRNIPLGDPIISKYRPGKANLLQVELQLFVEHGTIIMPAGLPGYESPDSNEAELGIGTCIILRIPELQLQFRMHDYYMEMSLNVGPISGGIISDYPQMVTYAKSALTDIKDIFLIDGVDITANRLFGPQPKTATYVCIWEIHLGLIRANLTASDGRLLSAAGNAFRLNYADLPNAPADEYLPPAESDVSFIKLSFSSIDITWQAGIAALVITLPLGIEIDGNDLGVLLTTSVKERHWLEAAEMTTDAFLDIYTSPYGYRDMVRTQIAHVNKQDQPTGRARHMFGLLGPLGFQQPSEPMLHTSALYLPHPKLPGLWNCVERDHPSLLGSKDNPSVGVHPLSNIAQISESDVEEGISEAGRNARLAKTRSSTPNPHFAYEDDQNMTSGDESDNEDLTDTSSNGNWSELANQDMSDVANLFMHYSHVTRHYIVRHLGSIWNGPSFFLIRDCTLPEFYQKEVAGISKSKEAYDNTPANPQRPVDLGDNQDVTSFHFKCTKLLDVKITPLILPAAVHFEEDMKLNPLSPELSIDSMMGSYLRSVPALGATGPCIFFEVSMSSVSVRLLQRINVTDGHPTVSRDDLQPHNHPKFGVIAIIQGNIDGILGSGMFMKGYSDFNARFNRLSLALDIPINRQTYEVTSSNEFKFTCGIGGITVDAVQDRLDVKWEKNEVCIGQLGPEYMTATSIALAHNIKQFVALSHRWIQYSSSLKQNIISNVIRSSEGKGTVDPLSTIQPSYLVQRGTPHKLRTDSTFKFLYHLRSCLWQLNAKERGLLRSPQEHLTPINPEDLHLLLESRLVTLDPDGYNIAHLSSLGHFFSIMQVRVPPASRTTKLPFCSMSVRFTKATVTILGPLHTPPSELVITDVHGIVYMRSTEVLQLPSPHSMSMSQTSLKEKRTQSIWRTTASVVLGEVTYFIFPHLVYFIQNVLRVRRRYYSILCTPTTPQSINRLSDGAFQLLGLDLTFSLHRLHVQAAAENLIFEFGLSGIHGASSILSQSQSRSMNHCVLFNNVYVRARSPAGMDKHSDQDILASLDLVNGKVNTASRKEPSSGANLRLIFETSIQLHVPRSVLRLYRLVEEWRADFLPGIETAIHDLLSELQRTPTKTFSHPTPQLPLQHPSIQIQGQLSSISVSLQVMHGTWLSWNINRTTGFFNSSTPSPRYNFGLELASTALSISSKSSAHDIDSGTRMKLVLPPLSIAGHYDGSYVHTIALVEFIEVKVKPSHWDTLLVVQQKFGQDFNDLVTLVQGTHKRRNTSTMPKPHNSRQSHLKYSGFLKIRGFRVGLEGLSSILYLECLDIDGGLNNTDGLIWNVDLSDLAFSLASRAAIDPPYSGFSRIHRSAFVIVDFRVNAQNKPVEELASTTIQISVTKIHAVMQPSSMGEVGDFIDQLQAEMLNRKEQRTLELAAFKEKTRSILKTFEVRARDTYTEERPWLGNYIVSIRAYNIGVAFPLIHDQELKLPFAGNRDSHTVRAFLWSIKSIEFGTHRGETGQAIMKGFSFQFIPRFRQSVPNDFLGENHQTRNRLIYPEMEAQLRSTRTTSSRHIQMGANVSGFVLSLDSTIPSYVFSLIDVYRQGKERMDKLSAIVPRTPSNETENSMTKKANLEKHYSNLPTSNIFASLTFLSGKVCVYSGSTSSVYGIESFSHSPHETSGEQVEPGAEVFDLPVVSVWAEYRATPASQKFNGMGECEPSILMFKSTVYSSQNTLRPTLLPFLTEIVSHVEARLRKVNNTSHPIPVITPEISTASQDQEVLDSVSSMRISFSLRIDQSKLELTCQPDVNVIAGLHWDNGGFVINISPGARKVTFTGSVGGLTLGLKHGFLSEDCVKLDARNLAFSVTFAKVESESELFINSVSIVLDTEFLGIIRFSRLQDILCFKAVWLDRIPVFNSQAAATSRTPPRTPIGPLNTSSGQAFSTVVLVQIRQIALDIDLGQSISAITLDLKEALIRTKLTEASSEVSVFVADLAINAKGNVAGQAHVPKCVFQTIRNIESNPSNVAGSGRMLELRMTSGPLIVSLESDHQKLLHYRAEPLDIKIHDDWSTITPQAYAKEKPLQLSFTVMSPEIVAVATVGTIPKLLAYVNKFQVNLDAQRQGASRESKTFRITRTPKPDNPLSAVAEAMLHSARSRFKEAGNGLSYVIMQHMSLQLDFLRLVVFPRTMDDLEIAQFISRGVRARLDRLVETEPTLGKRDLLLSFASMTISKFTGLGHPQSPDLADGREWLLSLLKDASEAIIVGLPSMTMHMVSEEIVMNQTTMLLYDFHSKSTRQGGTQEFKDIYITLNVSLYSWLTVLRKNLSREMDQVKAATDWRVLLNTQSSNTGTARKKVPEPLNLVAVDSPRSSTIPSPENKPFSPFSPTTALKSSMGELTEMPSTTSSNFTSTARDSLLPALQHSSSVEIPATRPTKKTPIIYQPRTRHIERLTMRQLGEATPDVMHPFFMKKAGFSLEDSLPQYVNEYATTPLEEIMEVLLKLYSRQLLSGHK